MHSSGRRCGNMLPWPEARSRSSRSVT
jgi:hypothetical protein